MTIATTWKQLWEEKETALGHLHLKPKKKSLNKKPSFVLQEISWMHSQEKQGDGV